MSHKNRGYKRRDILRFEAGQPMPHPADERFSSRRVPPFHLSPLYDLAEIRGQLEAANEGTDRAARAIAEHGYDQAIDLIHALGEEIVAAAQDHKVSWMVIMSGIPLQETGLDTDEIPNAA